jgi:hypothetical protein
MNGLDAYYAGLLAGHQRKLDKEAYDEEQAELEEDDEQGDEE